MMSAPMESVLRDKSGCILSVNMGAPYNVSTLQNIIFFVPAVIPLLRLVAVLVALY